MSLEKIELCLGDCSYEITLGNKWLSAFIEGLGEIQEAVVISDSNVSECMWFKELIKSLSTHVLKFKSFTIEAGEKSKSIDVFGQLCSGLAQEDFTRKTKVFAIGGGVVGDLAGFVAASYLRGVELIQIPTSLLAMVDSSVGGKTGVNLPEGKNLVGAFYQPATVWIDLQTLETLPRREVAAGMAEIIKYGMIWDKDLFEEVRNGVPEDLQSIISRCIKIKAEIVEADERETSGKRALLNFGHTVGHGLEQLTGYGKLLHGEAVAIGMMAAATISQEHLGLSQSEVDALKKAIKSNDLPSSFEGISYESLKCAMARDKKATAQGLRWVLCPRIGQSAVYDDVSEGVVRKAVEQISEVAAT
ncbi:MAG: 3-dehydroquinate synthase [Verrucomicrobiota bacterium]